MIKEEVADSKDVNDDEEKVDHIHHIIKLTHKGPIVVAITGFDIEASSRHWDVCRYIAVIGTH